MKTSVQSSGAGVSPVSPGNKNARTLPARLQPAGETPAPRMSIPVRTSVGNYFISNYPPFSCWSAGNLPCLMEALNQPPGSIGTPASGPARLAESNEHAGSETGAPVAGPLGLYVHLPFCRQRCHYCYFRVYPRRAPADIDLYIESVLKELSLYLKYPGFAARPLSSVYFGGGSPSYLSTEQIQRLLRGLQQRSGWDAVEECTFECEPGTVTLEKLRALKQFGVTRLSLGFQSLNDSILRHNGRNVTVGECLASFRMARDAGFDEINIDLLAGLPGETQKTWRHTIDEVLQLSPDCVTIYQCELTWNSAIYGSMRAGRALRLPTWSSKRSWVAEAFQTFERAGYVIGSGYMAIREPARWRFVYTVEHFWHGEDLLALGETSFGHLRGVHYQNTDTFESYVSLLEQDKLPLRRALKLTAEEKLRREVILLLKTGSLDWCYFRKKFGVDLASHFAEQFEPLFAKGLAEIDGHFIRLSREGLLEVDWLLPNFYLPEHKGLRYT